MQGESIGLTIPKNFFGVHIFNPMATWHDIGHGAIRLWDTGTTWKNLEKSKGVFDWTRMDSLMNYATGHGLDVLYECGQTPNWAGPPDSYTDYNGHPPTKDQDWIDYLAAVATRYKGKIQAYEIWNEADVQGQGGIVRFYLGTWDRLAQLCRLAYSTLKSIDSNVTIIAPSFTKYNPSMFGAFLDAVALDYYARHSGATSVNYNEYFDVIALHTYDYAPEAIIATSGSNQVWLMRNVLADKGINLPLWNTETGFGNYSLNGKSITTGQNFTPDDINVMPDDLSMAYIVREYLMNLFAGFEKVYYYAADYRSNRLRLINPLDLSKTTPAGDVLKKISDLMVGALIKDVVLENNLYVMSFAKNEVNFSIVWNPDYRTGTWTPPLRVDYTETLSGVKTSPANAVIATSNQPLIVYEKPGTITSATTATNSNGIVTIVPTLTNLILNGDFAQGDSMWDNADLGTAGKWSFSNGVAALTYNGRSYKGQNIYIPSIKGNKQYRINYTFSGNRPQDSYGCVMASEFNTNYSLIGQHLDLRDGNTFWTAANINYLRVYIGANSGIGDCTFDNFSITEVEAIITYTLTYTAGAGGSISGNSSQTVVSGGRGTQVMAVPNNGYRFINWSDGLLTASRTDTNVKSNISVTAIFAQVATGNLVINGDFSSNSGSGWEISNKGTVNTVSFSTGKAVLTCKGATGFIHQYINCQPNTSYKMTFNFTGPSTGGNGGNVAIEEWQNNTWKLGHYSLNAKPQPTVFTTASTTNRLFVRLGSGDLTTGIFNFDNIVVELNK